MATALITGATAGIGAAFARRLAADGFDLVLLARDKKRLDEAVEEHQAKHGATVEALAADLATEDGIASAEKRLTDAERAVDLLINNAGFGLSGKFLDVPVEEELAMLRVHCEAVLRLTHAALPGMLKRGRGGVINVASVAAFFPGGTYSASKAWMVNFTESIAHDAIGHGVHVLALCPGYTRTEFHERAGMDVSGTSGFTWLSADRVVDEALRDLRKGALVSIPGLQYKSLVGLGRLVPRRLAGRWASRAAGRYRGNPR